MFFPRNFDNYTGTNTPKISNPEPPISKSGSGPSPVNPGNSEVFTLFCKVLETQVRDTRKLNDLIKEVEQIQASTDSKLNPELTKLFQKIDRYSKSYFFIKWGLTSPEYMVEQFIKNLPSSNKSLNEQSIDEINYLSTVSKNYPPQKVRQDFYKICGCSISYANWKVGDKIPSPGAGIGEYRVDKIIQNERGLQIIILGPVKDGDPPILCCRGTDPNNLHNILDDIGISGRVEGIGQYSYEASEQEIYATIKELKKTYNQDVIITGHSLGGALAQIITANCMIIQEGNSLTCPIKECYFFNAPGVGTATARSYITNAETLRSQDVAPPTTTHIRHKEDIVPDLGGDHIYTDHVILTKKEFSRLERHTNPGLIWELFHHQIEIPKIFKGKIQRQAVHTFVYGIAEGLKALIGGVVANILKGEIAKDTIKRIQSQKKINDTIIK